MRGEGRENRTERKGGCWSHGNIKTKYKDKKISYENIKTKEYKTNYKLKLSLLKTRFAHLHSFSIICHILTIIDPGTILVIQ